MKVLNIHKRVINQPKEKIAAMLDTLATRNDMILSSKWPPMRLSEGLKEGSRGGHGPIRYAVQKFIPHELVQFEFTRPKGFDGSHKFEITELEKDKTEIRHTIEMDIHGMAMITWPLAIRWLHDAFIEDAFDNTENHFRTEKKKTGWNSWVKILRAVLG